MAPRVGGPGARGDAAGRRCRRRRRPDRGRGTDASCQWRPNWTHPPPRHPRNGPAWGVGGAGFRDADADGRRDGDDAGDDAGFLGVLVWLLVRDQPGTVARPVTWGGGTYASVDAAPGKY